MRCEFQPAIELLESAQRRDPANVRLLLDLGRKYGLRYDYAAAERYFEKALRLAPRKTEMFTAVLDHCLDFRNLDFEERYLRRALEQPDATPYACVKLAELYERSRRLPEAAQLVDRALKSDPASPVALLARARQERLAGRLEAAEQVLRSFITKPFPNVWTSVRAGYELGTILDLQQKFDDAMAAFREAKTLMLSHPQTGACLARNKATLVHLKAMAPDISAGTLRRWHESGPALTPARRLGLLCGHPRSGTTLLEQVLDAHPDIIAAEETSTFTDDALGPLMHDCPMDAQLLPVLEAATRPALQQSQAAYFQMMELALDSPIAGRLLIDKNPMLTPKIPAFIRILPETKFLVALRDPRDVMMSCFTQPQGLNPATVSFLTLEGTAEHYSANMGLWRKLAPLMPVPYLEVRYEDMVEDLEAVARKTLDFLGIAWDARVLEFAEHARKRAVRRPNYAEVTQPVYKRARGRWHNYQKYLEPHLEKLEPFVKAFGYE